MTDDTLIRVRPSGQQTEVLVLVKHPMETGRRQDPATGKIVAARFIESITFELNGTVVAVAGLGPAVASNPLTGIRLARAQPGDQLRVQWSDNSGLGGGARATLE